VGKGGDPGIKRRTMAGKDWREGEARKEGGNWGKGWTSFILEHGEPTSPL